MLAWITLPTSTELVSGIGQYTQPIFQELLPVAGAVAGIFIAVLLLRFLFKSIVNAVQRMTGRGRGGRRAVRRI